MADLNLEDFEEMLKVSRNQKKTKNLSPRTKSNPKPKGPNTAVAPRQNVINAISRATFSPVESGKTIDQAEVTRDGQAVPTKMRRSGDSRRSSRKT